MNLLMIIESQFSPTLSPQNSLNCDQLCFLWNSFFFFSLLFSALVFLCTHSSLPPFPPLSPSFSFSLPFIPIRSHLPLILVHFLNLVLAFGCAAVFFFSAKMPNLIPVPVPPPPQTPPRNYVRRGVGVERETKEKKRARKGKQNERGYERACIWEREGDLNWASWENKI